MFTRCALSWLPRAGVLATVVLTPAVLAASDPIKGVRKFNPDDETVEIFSAVDAGKLEVRLIAKDSTQCRLLITNKTARPLNVRLPEAVAGVPVLAQNFGDFANFGDNRSGNNAPQQMGVGNPFGVQGAGNQRPPNGRGGREGRRDPFFAPFNIAPEKVAQLRLAAVCLEHGKPNPRPAMPYQLQPLASVTEASGVRELCAMLGREEVSQRAAQAAAWHLNNHLSWEDLKSKRYKVAFGRTRPFFTPSELAEAEQAADDALETARKGKRAREQGSLSLK